MLYTDAAVIGAGVLGCFTARALTELEISVTVIEEKEDVCTGITRANTGIIYTGCDNRPGSRKAAMCVKANREFDQLARGLDVRFSRCGSVMAAFGPRGEAVLRRKYRQGLSNGVPGLRLLSRDELAEAEPLLSRDAVLGLYAPGTGTVEPWELGIAAFENASANGALFRLNEKLIHMERSGSRFILETDRETILTRTVINCAGLSADAVREMLRVPAVRIFPTGADYIVLGDSLKGQIRHVIFHEPEEKRKGLTIVPAVDGSILAGPTERSADLAPEGATCAEGLEELRKLCAEVVPDLPLTEQIRTFSALRPNPRSVQRENGRWVPVDHSIRDFLILNEDGLISLIGIKTPGLTCAAELGRFCASLAAGALSGPGRNRHFNPRRTGIPRVHEMKENDRAALIRTDPDFGEIVCQCHDVTAGEIREAIRRGAVTPDGVKRRTGAGMGVCQGCRCISRVQAMLTGMRKNAPQTDSPGHSGTEEPEEKHGIY